MNKSNAFDNHFDAIQAVLAKASGISVNRKFSEFILGSIVIVLLTVSSAHAEEYRAKLSSEATKSIWLKSCESSLFEAQNRFGSKITFPSKRDRQTFIYNVCNKAADEQLKHFVKLL